MRTLAALFFAFNILTIGAQGQEPSDVKQVKEIYVIGPCPYGSCLSLALE